VVFHLVFVFRVFGAACTEKIASQVFDYLLTSPVNWTVIFHLLITKAMRTTQQQQQQQQQPNYE